MIDPDPRTEVNPDPITTLLALDKKSLIITDSDRDAVKKYFFSMYLSFYVIIFEIQPVVTGFSNLQPCNGYTGTDKIGSEYCCTNGLHQHGQLWRGIR
jgi:hypothetical protein